MDRKVVIGFAPTRRRIFSVEDALKYKGLIRAKMQEMNLEFVDIEDINPMTTENYSSIAAPGRYPLPGIKQNWTDLLHSRSIAQVR